LSQKDALVKATRFLVPALSTLLLLPSLGLGVCQAGTFVPIYRARENTAPRVTPPGERRVNLYQKNNIRGFLAGQPVGADTLNVLGIQVQFADSLMRSGQDSTYFANELKHLAEYFAGASRGQLSVQWAVTSRVYDLPEPMGYYGTDDLEDIRDVELVQTLIDSADSDIDFSLYDTFMIIHADAGSRPSLTARISILRLRTAQSRVF
jgi:hypothetical protein